MDLSPGVRYFIDQLSRLFLTLGSHLSLSSLLCALAVCILILALRRRKRHRRIRIRTIARALFPRRIIASPSSQADLGFLFFNGFVFSLMLGWAVLSYQFVSNGVAGLLAAVLGPAHPTGLPDIVCRSVTTLMLFLAYELGYWLNHYLSHRLRVLWEFHRVHHTATVLTPLTVFRVHPVYTWVFSNIVAVATAIANGLAGYIFGKATYQYALSDTNIILVLFIHAYVHLQHSQIWIAFPGVWGRLFMSPAHHQLHHSTNPDHFNKNLGSCLAIWDWMFGTLYVPGHEPEQLRFGLDQDSVADHSITGCYLAPLARAAAPFTAFARAQLSRRSAPPAQDRKPA